MDESNVYKGLGLHKYSFHYLSTIGLVEYDWNHKYILPKQKLVLKYGDNIVKIRSEQRLEYGNVRLTSDGSLLHNALKPVYNEDYFNFCIRKWEESGGTVIIDNY